MEHGVSSQQLDKGDNKTGYQWEYQFQNQYQWEYQCGRQSGTRLGFLGARQMGCQWGAVLWGRMWCQVQKAQKVLQVLLFIRWLNLSPPCVLHT